VSCRPAWDAIWGVYLVDVFDNFTLHLRGAGQAMFEPIALRRTPRPPVDPRRRGTGDDHSDIMLADVHAGP
jgi:hypothetical protein